MDPVARTAIHLALEQLFNKVLTLDPASAPRLRSREGQMLGLCLQPPGVDLALLFQDGQIRVFSEREGQLDARIIGTPLAVLRFLTATAAAPAVPTDIAQEGDSQLVEDFRLLLQNLEPDWEAELAQHLGDVLAHEAGRHLRRGIQWGQKVHQTLLANLAEYVTEEARILPGRAEVEARLLSQLPPLDQRLDDLEQRLQRLERRLQQPSTSS